MGVVLVSVAASSCSSLFHPTPEPPGPGPRPDTARAVIVQQAVTLYDYGEERLPLGVSDPAFPGTHVDDGTIPRMRIATARLKANTPQPSARIIARITSEGDYAPMGIRAGDNYVWRNTWRNADSASWVTRIVPRDPSGRTHDLVRDYRKHEYTHERAEEPRLVLLQVRSVGLGICLDDPVCGTGHCGYY
jgi:hypothetical protein